MNVFLQLASTSSLQEYAYICMEPTLHYWCHCLPNIDFQVVFRCCCCSGKKRGYIKRSVSHKTYEHNRNWVNLPIAHVRMRMLVYKIRARTSVLDPDVLERLQNEGQDRNTWVPCRMYSFCLGLASSFLSYTSYKWIWLFHLGPFSNATISGYFLYQSSLITQHDLVAFN